MMSNVIEVKESVIDRLVTDGAFGMEARLLLMEMREILETAITDKKPFHQAAASVLAKVDDYEARWNEEMMERKEPAPTGKGQ